MLEMFSTRSVFRQMGGFFKVFLLFFFLKGKKKKKKLNSENYSCVCSWYGCSCEFRKIGRCVEGCGAEFIKGLNPT